MKPKIGHLLFSSCRGEDFAKIIAVNDDNTVDIQFLVVFEVSYDSGDDTDDVVEMRYLPGSILANIPYEVGRLQHDPPHLNINLDTPGDGCYRCDKYFQIYPLGDEFDKLMVLL